MFDVMAHLQSVVVEDLSYPILPNNSILIEFVPEVYDPTPNNVYHSLKSLLFLAYDFDFLLRLQVICVLLA